MRIVPPIALLVAIVLCYERLSRTVGSEGAIGVLNDAGEVLEDEIGSPGLHAQYQKWRMPGEKSWTQVIIRDGREILHRKVPE